MPLRKGGRGHRLESRYPARQHSKPADALAFASPPTDLVSAPEKERLATLGVDSEDKLSNFDKRMNRLVF
jgi:hypothetical protein